MQKLTRSKNRIALDDLTKDFDEDGYPIPAGITLMDPAVVSAVLCNYSKLKQDSYDDFEGDMWYLIYDFERICDKALEPHPLLMRLMEMKIDGNSNSEIQLAL